MPVTIEMVDESGLKSLERPKDPLVTQSKCVNRCLITHLSVFVDPKAALLSKQRR